MTLTMVPSLDNLPDVLPTSRLTKTGMPIGELRVKYRKIENLRNIGSVLLCWAQAFITIGVALWLNNVLSYIIAVIMMGPVFARFSILGHESAHRLLFSNKTINDFVGKWLLAYPAFIPFNLYRRSHFAHHRDELGPLEPDISLYRGYPISKASFKRKLIRDATGISGWKNLKLLLKAVFIKEGRPIVLPILCSQLILILISVILGLPLVYFVLWLLPWLTSWRVINRLRAIAEHGGMKQSKDRRETTHHVHQGLLPKFFIVPFNTGWHLAHHSDMGVPWRQLPKLHKELVDAGWVTPSITWPSYTSLWKALANGE